MTQMSKDLLGKPEISWIADIHTDTDNPHCHVLFKGLLKTGQDITIPKYYIKEGFRKRIEHIATGYLGTRSLKDIQETKIAKIKAKRLTSYDHAIISKFAENPVVQGGDAEQRS